MFFPGDDESSGLCCARSRPRPPNETNGEASILEPASDSQRCNRGHANQRPFAFQDIPILNP